jgi:hypothetical protein
MIKLAFHDKPHPAEEKMPIEVSKVESDYDWAILECIDDALGVLGENAKFTLYWKLLIISNLDKGGIVQNPELFISALEKTFGLGSWAIVREIATKLKSRFKLKSDSEDISVVIRAIRASKLTSDEIEQ